MIAIAVTCRQSVKDAGYVVFNGKDEIRMAGLDYANAYADIVDVIGKLAEYYIASKQEFLIWIDTAGIAPYLFDAFQDSKYGQYVRMSIMEEGGAPSYNELYKTLMDYIPGLKFSFRMPEEDPTGLYRNLIIAFYGWLRTVTIDDSMNDHIFLNKA